MNQWLFSRFSPVIKVVSAGCNIRCSYCFYAGHQPEIKIMEVDLLKEVIEKSLEVAPSVKIIAHGGEPTIPGVAYYERLLEFANAAKSPRQYVDFSLQTNGTLLSPAWLDFLQTGRISVGVSLDGPDFMHDFTRIDARGRGTFGRVMRGVNALRDRGIKFGVVAVINSFTVDYPDELFSFMRQNNLSFSANPCTANPSDPPEVQSLAISPFRYAEYLLRLLDLWLQADDPKFRIRPLEDLVKAVLGKQPTLCRFVGMCHQYVTVDSNGDVYPCDTFLDNQYCLGNLAKQTFAEIFGGDLARNYYSGRNQMAEACGDCQWFTVCRGGCMRTWEGEKTVNSPREHEFCQARQFLFEETKLRLEKLGYHKGGDNVSAG